MKKFLAILVIAGTLVACNDSANSTDGADATNMNTTITTDSNTIVNTTINADTSDAGMNMDTSSANTTTTTDSMHH